LGYTLLALLYLAAGGWLIRAVAPDPLGTIPGWPGDNFYFLWQLAWVREALRSGTSPLWTDRIFYPEGFHLARDDMTLLNTLPGALLGGIIGDPLAYTLLLLLSSTLSGLVMALWLRQLTGSLLVGVLGGLAFVWLPFRAIRQAGHLDLVTTWPIPLTLLLLDRALLTGQRRWWALAGLAFVLVGLGAWYFAPLFALVLPGYVLVRGGLRRWRQAETWQGGALFVLVAGALLLPAALPYFLVPGGLQHPIREALKASASPTDYLVPSVLHPFWGELARAYFAGSEFGAVDRAVSPGFVVLALAGVGLAVRRCRATAALATLAGIAFLFSLGPAFQWQGEGVIIPWPPWLGRWLTSLSPSVNDYLGPTAVRNLQAGIGFIPLPALVVTLLVPAAQAVRAWARLGIFVDVALIGLAGFGLQWLLGRWRPLALVVAALLLLDLATEPLPASAVAPRPVDQWLRAHDDGRPVVVMPILAATEPREVWATLHHRRPIIHGHATFPPPRFRAAQSVLARFPAEEALQLLRQLGVRQIVVFPAAYGPAWPEVAQQLAARAELRLAARLEGAEVWELQ
jgi:hypothetical protein